MLVESMKIHSNIYRTDLEVDAWITTHNQDGDITEKYDGKSVMENVEEILYLGAVISCDGKNFKNIIHKRNKAIGIQKQILIMVSGLGKYTIECGFIYLNSLLRASILYGAEAMMNITEEDYRKLEQIEESLMRQLFVTDKSCPLHLMYLEVGQVPARYQIKRMILNLHQYILKQDNESMMKRMLMAQIVKPVRNDFCQKVNSILTEVGITMTYEQIGCSKRSEYRNIVKKKCTEAAFSYLKDKQKQGKKGACISYTCFEMADYLQPGAGLEIDEQREIFSIRTQTNPLGANKGDKEYCEYYGEVLDNSHIFTCKIINNMGENKNMEKILNGNINEKKEALEIWRKNIQKFKNYLRNQ